tara:strand:+ start:1283 stop:1672 length:390 start_codon:yes stop_codon:yes gene_type:complete
MNFSIENNTMSLAQAKQAKADYDKGVELNGGDGGLYFPSYTQIIKHNDKYVVEVVEVEEGVVHHVAYLEPQYWGTSANRADCVKQLDVFNQYRMSDEKYGKSVFGKSVNVDGHGELDADAYHDSRNWRG